MNPASLIKAIVFDMDGLLIDSEPFWRRAEIATFRTVGLELTDDDCAKTMGVRVDEVVHYWFEQKPWNGISPEAVAESIVSEVIRLVRSEGKAMPGVRELIAFFRARGLPMAIASSSYQKLIDVVVSSLGIEQDIVLSYSAENEAFGKPHPGVYLTACKQLGVEPAAALAFEDSPNGVKAARAAGMRCVFVPEAGVPQALLATVDATVQLHSLNEFDEGCWQALNCYRER